MRAIVQDRYGEADVLELREIDRPIPADGEVVVRVVAAGFDPGVWHVMAGIPYLVRLMGFGFSKPKIPVRGTDVAGIVETVGGNVTEFRPGDEVFGGGRGSFAEYVRCETGSLVRKPANISFEQASTYASSGLTAVQGLRAGGGAEPGKKILIIGAAGGVGSFAVQIARESGAEVTGVCSTTKIDIVHSLGAQHVIDYEMEDFADGRGQWDLILDTAGNRPLKTLRRALAPEGALVIVGGEGGGRWLAGLERNLAAALLSPFVGQKLTTIFAGSDKDDLATLRDLAEAGKLVPIMDRTYTLAETPDAIRHWRGGRSRATLVLSPSG